MAASAGALAVPRGRTTLALAVLVFALSVTGVVLAVLAHTSAVPESEQPSLVEWCADAVVLVGLGAIGALLLVRVRGNALGPLLYAAALGLAVNLVAHPYAVISHYDRPLAAERWVAWIAEWSYAPYFLVGSLALLLFPTGRPPSSRWLPAFVIGLAAPALIALDGLLSRGDDLDFNRNPLTGDGRLADLAAAGQAGFFLLAPAAAVGVASLVIRRRQAAADERAAIALLARAAALLPAAFAICLVVWLTVQKGDPTGRVVVVVALGVLGCAMGVAILRHRLHGVDVFVNRTLVYVVLTLGLGGAYVVVVLAAARALGSHIELGVALPATAAVALAFAPARAFVQRSVARLLYGDRGDPGAAVMRLSRRVGETEAPADVLPTIATTIAEALRLPYVAIELDRAQTTAAYGTAAAGVAMRLRLDHGGERIGTLVLGARAHGEDLSAADRRLLDDLARQAALAAQAVDLGVEVQRSRERIVSAREEERRRLRGDLHDGLGPTLAGAVLSVEAAGNLVQREPARAEQLLGRAAEDLRTAVGDIRRLVYGLRPPALDELGLSGALREYATRISTEVECALDVPDRMPDLPAAVEVAGFRIVQEALTNVVRHASATQVRVHVSACDSALTLTVTDDGRGIPTGRAPGVGLTSMRERVAELGGELAIGPGEGERGTRVHVALPLESHG